MAEEPRVIRGIDWRATFPFTNIFRSFRIAVHPSKLILGLALILLMYLGGRVLDAIWPARHLAVSSEIALWQQATTSAEPAKAFDTARRDRREATEREYASMLRQVDNPPVKDRAEAEVAAREGRHLSIMRDRVLEQRGKLVKSAMDDWDKNGEKKTGADRDAALRVRDRAVANAYAEAESVWKQVESIKGRGIFITFFEYEVGQINAVVGGVVANNWLVAGGVTDSISNFLTVGPGWLLSAHPLYFVLFILWLLILWAVFGGAIARIAALHVARDEKLSMKQALKFSVAKGLSFVSAPLIPLLIILVIGLIVSAVSLLGNVPWVGPILVGAPFVLALAGGFVMTLMLIGTVGGFTLMYPTIAVEGSDSFDAISRSFSYIYARPWRMLFYTAVAVAYGALCYLFVRIFVYLILTLTHGFVGLGMFAHAAPGVPLWPTLLPAPVFQSMPYQIPFLSLNTGGDIGAWFVAFWIYILLAIMGAFVISFYFSANTIIYYLMRREVDATEMDDVYREEAEEEFADTAPVVETPADTAPPAPVDVPATAAPSAQPTATEMPAPAVEPPPTMMEPEIRPDEPKVE